MLSFLLFLAPQPTVYAANYNYGEALQKAIMFYEFQMSVNCPITFATTGVVTHVSAMEVMWVLTLQEVGLMPETTLNSTFPWLTTSMLAWAVYEYKDALVKSGQLTYLMDQIKWASDYFIKCHPEKSVYYYQVGDGDGDHRWWVPAECIESSGPKAGF